MFSDQYSCEYWGWGVPIPTQLCLWVLPCDSRCLGLPRASYPSPQLRHQGPPGGPAPAPGPGNPFLATSQGHPGAHLLHFQLSAVTVLCSPVQRLDNQGFPDDVWMMQSLLTDSRQDPELALSPSPVPAAPRSLSFTFQGETRKGEGLPPTGSQSSTPQSPWASVPTGPQSHCSVEKACPHKGEKAICKLEASAHTSLRPVRARPAGPAHGRIQAQQKDRAPRGSWTSILLPGAHPALGQVRGWGRVWKSRKMGWGHQMSFSPSSSSSPAPRLPWQETPPTSTPTSPPRPPPPIHNQGPTAGVAGQKGRAVPRSLLGFPESQER